MAFKYLTELSSDYKRLFEEEIGCDVIIYAGEEPNIKEIHAHSNILCNKSQYFRTAFSNVWAEKKDGKFILRNPNISPHLFMNILSIETFILADELNIQQLISYIQEYLIEHQIEFLQQNPIDIIETIYQHESFTNLRDFWLEKICEVPEILFYSDKFIELKASLLELLIKRDDLNMDEIEIWEDEKDISTAKLGYVNNAALAIYYDTFEGLSMGELDCADSNEWTYRATYNDYPNINIPETFIVEHYEVFQVKIY
ncbi:unnamed protein product [Rhizophagus irregularis]|nr:unnamed protein product [Rhizophagus irregularis]